MSRETDVTCVTASEYRKSHSGNGLHVTDVTGLDVTNVTGQRVTDVTPRTGTGAGTGDGDPYIDIYRRPDVRTLYK